MRGKDFHELAELLPLTVFEVDTQGRFTYVNQFGLTFSGYTAEEVARGIFVSQVVVPGEGVSIEGNLRARMLGGSDSNSEYFLLTQAGSRIPVTVKASPILDGDRIVGLRGVVVDLSEQKRLEAATARAERLEAAGQIAGQVAHDFNNLLAPLLAYPQLIRETMDSASPAQRFLEDIEIATRQLADISQQLLTLARRGHYELLPLDINDVVSDALELSRERPATLVVRVRLGADLGTVQGGEAQLLRVFLNLVTNARDAMGDVGELEISTERVVVNERLGILGRIPAGRYVAVTIKDTGTGIAPAHLPRIFEPFFSTKRADRRRGSGLGLSTTYAVLKDHGGYLDVETQVGKGTTFIAYLPVSDQPLNSEHPQELEGGDEHVIVIDDDPMQRQVGKTLLERLGYRVSLAVSGEQAISMLESGIRPDLALLDMLLGSGIDGAQTYRRLIELQPNLKAIVLSGYAETEQVREALRLGAGRFVRKPLELSVLARAVRTELARPRASTG
ncbi:MAG: response regulator [Polyangiaceae bacterium]